MAAPTALTVEVDLEEYSRFEPDKDTITVTITPAGTDLLNEQITVELIKARRNNDVSVATVTMTLTSNTPAPQDIQFILPKIVDNEEVPKVRRGEYLVRTTSVTDTNITADSVVFLISLITVEELKKSYLHGTTQLSSDVLAVHEQPMSITGVEVINVSPAHPQKWFPLAYSYADDGQGNIVRTLSWCEGPVVSITSSKKIYTLRRGNSDVDWIEVRIRTISLLPTVSVVEDLLIQRQPLNDQEIRNIIDRAISWVEDSELTVYLEPTIVVTQVDPTTVTFPAGSDIPTFVNADWDCVVDALLYKVPRPGHWIGFKMPYQPVIRFNQLFGQLANVRIVDIALEWIELHNKGWVELVPFNQEVAFNFIGLVWVESIRGPVPLPNFWNFNALVGYKKTPRVLIELVAKKAAMDILTIAGQAFRGGFSSTSVSRDGVSESVSYTASARYGIYSASIEDYRKWIDDNLKKLRGATRGHNMIVV